MAVDAQAIRDFVAANIDNPQAIASAAQANGVSVADIASAMSLPVESVNTYFSSASVPPPVPETQVASVAQAQPTALSTSQPTTYNIPGVTDQQISVLKQYSPEMWTALQTGNAKVTQSGGQTQIVDKTTGQPFDTSGLQVAVLPNNQLSITGWGGKAQQVGATTSIDPSGNVAPLTDQNISRVNQYGVDYGGITLQQVIQVGLAYALPIVGEAIAAELAVSTSVGTALAAVGTGVAQGKTIEESIKAAAPSLIASGVMDQAGLNDLSLKITDNKQLQNVINNVASSTVKTAIAGGTAQDLLTNAIATGGGTLLGQNLDSQFAGQTLASTLATGDATKGLAAGAGVLGQDEATRNAIERQVGPIMNAPASGIDSQTQAIINQLGAGSQDPGILTAANALPNLNAVAASALPAMLGTGNEKSGPIQVQTDAEGEVTYTRTITGVDANGKPYQYVATYDPLETTPNRQVSYSIPGLLGSSETEAPTVAGTSSAYTRPTFDTAPEGEGISTKIPPDLTITTAGIGDKGSVSQVPGAGVGDTKAGPSAAGGTTGGVASTAGPGAGVVGLVDGSGAGGLGTGGGGAGPGDGKGTGGTGTGGGGSGGGGNGDGGVISVDTFTPSITTITPDKTDTKVVDKTTPPSITDSTDVSITTSTVKPKIQASYPTIAGQFASPLTQAVSAYRPPGEVESQATGKEREDVWNVESLRNALGI